ncbi:MAG: AAA domain-containing protein [Bacteriovoracaceae bacterium]|jgi:ATP-dependent Clp protease ATP-binding subunit ClpA|nr:AAA domain-containing protein [Bacteriovoracaceae bacterium]
MKFLCILMLTLSFSLMAAAPDMTTLKTAGRIIHSEVAGFATDHAWEKTTKVMKDLKIFDAQVNRMMQILCSPETNKSVLLVGEANDTYKYFFSRLAMMDPLSGCTKFSHVDFEVSKLQGYMYVGTTEKKWQDLIEKTSYDKDVVLYFNNLRRLIGIGTSSNKSVGIESTLATAIASGKLKVASYMNKYDYNELIRSRHAYVLDAFQEVIQIQDITMAQVDLLVDKYLAVHGPHLKLSDETAFYMYKKIEYFQPNIEEPQRTMDILRTIMDRFKMKNEYFASTARTDKPYKANENKTFVVEKAGAVSLKLYFEYFQTDYSDTLTIYDGNTGTVLDKFQGRLGKFASKEYTTSKLKLVFKSNGSYQGDGFKIANVMARVQPTGYDITKEDVRMAIFKRVQVPRWIIDRDYSLVRNLRTLLDKDVVGVLEGKKAVIRSVRIGYVSGRTDEKPAGTILFVGPTGTGKSYIAKKAAEYMQMKTITMDMTQYATSESFDRFVTTMSNYLVLYPYAVYLFEEIDKANPRVLDRLYFMMDEGIFYDKNQRPLFARGAMLYMTTNAGHKLIIKEKDNPKLKTLVHQELQKYYRPSFLNRFDSIPIFKPFSPAEYKQLAKIMVTKKLQKLKEHYDWKLDVDDATMDFIAKNGGSDLYGARPMERLIDSVIAMGISEYQIMVGTIAYGAQISISKLARGATAFKVSVSGRSSVEFEVDLDNNSGLHSYTDPIILSLLASVKVL